MLGPLLLANRLVNKFADDNKVVRFVDNEEGYHSVQWELDQLQK